MPQIRSSQGSINALRNRALHTIESHELRNRSAGQHPDSVLNALKQVAKGSSDDASIAYDLKSIHDGQEHPFILAEGGPTPLKRDSSFSLQKQSATLSVEHRAASKESREGTERAAVHESPKVDFLPMIPIFPNSISIVKGRNNGYLNMAKR